MPATIPNQEHGGSTDPRLTMRKQERRQLRRIEGKLERRWKTIEFNDDQLREISIVRGAPFDIDEDDPIDLEPRFFLPGPVEKMEYGLEVIHKTTGLERLRWPQAEPIKHHRLKNGDELQYDIAAHNAHEDAAARGLFCENAAGVATSWGSHFYMPVTKIPNCLKVWPSPEDGRPCWHIWRTGTYYAWSKGTGRAGYDPNVPHAMATVHDMSPPRSQGLLHSELLVATGLLRAQIRQPRMYLDHDVYPVLVVSFHARFSARVIQAYLENGQMVVRPSRLINLYTRTISLDVRLLIRWLNSRPVGDTRAPALETKPTDDDSSIPLASTLLEATDKQDVLPPSISVQ